MKAFTIQSRAILAGISFCLAQGVFAERASAQTPDARNIDGNRLRPASTQEGILNVESGSVPGHLEWDLGVFFDYSDDAFTLEDNGERAASLLQSRTDAHILGSIAFYNRFQIAIDLPVTLNQTRGERAISTFNLEDIESGGLNDIALTPKLRIIDQAGYGVDLSLLGRLTITTASPGDAYLGEDRVTFTPELAVSRSFGGLKVAANAAFLFRENVPSRAIGLNVDHELIVRAGASYDFAPFVGRPLRGEITLESFTPLRRPFNRSNTTGLEWLAGVSLPVIERVSFFAGAGTALASAYSVPDYRLLGGFRVNERDSDRDGDGVLDRVDRCADAPEDMDGFEDQDGCPDLDNDGDGVPDRADGDPLRPEDRDGFQDSDGVPDIDNDGDGVLDEDDGAPESPEDPDGFEDTDGVPDLDNDKDGIPDTEDQAPNDPEDRDGFQDEDGVPDIDNDGDGVLDADDAAPLEPEDFDNFQDEDGAPDPDNDGDGVVDGVDNCPSEPGVPEFFGCKKKQLVAIKGCRIEISEKIFFSTGRRVIRPVSFPVLNNIVAVLKAQDQIKVLRVEGHTDAQGAEERNKRLSQERAESVRDYLVNQGIEPSRLRAIGFGEEKPIQTNNSARGRAANRRVEFLIDDCKETSEEVEP